MEKREVKEMNEVRASFYETVKDVVFEGHQFVGMGTEGAIFVNAEGNYAVVKVIAKKADFDAEAEVAKVIEREKANAEKEAERAAKAAAKAEKARKRAEEKAAKEAEAESAE